MSITLRVLGSKSPYPTPGSPCSGYLIDASGTLILVELGLAVWPELLRHVDPNDLTAIWISHLHPDHCGDIFAAYQWAANTEHAKRLPVYGPPEWADHIGAALPIVGGPAQILELFDVHDHDHHAGQIDLNSGVTLTPIPVQHSVPTYGIRITHDNATFAFSGDSGPCDTLTTLATDADLFLCEAGSTEPGQAIHCTPEEAAHAARGARRLMLTHLATNLTPQEAAHRASGATVATPGTLLTLSRP